MSREMEGTTRETRRSMGDVRKYRLKRKKRKQREAMTTTGEKRGKETKGDTKQTVGKESSNKKKKMK